MNIFEQAIDLHARWKLRLANAIIDGAVIDVADIGNCHACELGAWIYSNGLKYNNLDSFEAMCSGHEHFHRAAAEVALYGNAGDIECALALLRPDGVLELASRRLVELLEECSRELDLAEETPCQVVTVGDILDRKEDKRVYSIDAGAPIRDALKIMVADQIGLLVVNRYGQFTGLFTERGFVQHVATRQSLSLDDPVDAAIDHKLISINRASSLDDCMEIMSATHMRYAVVLGADRAEGIISVADIINELKTNKTYPYRPDKGLCPTAVPGFGLGVGHREQ